MEVPTCNLSFQPRTPQMAPVIWLLVTILFLCAAAGAGDENVFRQKKDAAADAATRNPGLRLYYCLFERRSQTGQEVGLESLDPLFWANTKYLLAGDSHKRALACLDDFLASHGDRAIENLLQRAILQRDLWALFDWSAQEIERRDEESRELQSRLAEVLRRVALSTNQIRGLPDPYEIAVRSGKYPDQYDPANPQTPFLPTDFFQLAGPWVCISAKPTATVHLQAFSGRSRFLVFLRLPAGRRATMDYLHRLYTFPQPLIYSSRTPGPELNLKAPQFPAGTKVALIRQMMLVDDKAVLTPTPVTESIQIRVFHSVTPGSPYMNHIGGPSSHDQDFYEFRFDKAAMLAGKPVSLTPVAADAREFTTFMSQGIDPFEQRRSEREPNDHGMRPTMRTCIACHADSGIHSMQSREKLVAPNPEQQDRESSDPVYGAIYWETESTRSFKSNRYDWGLLNGYWRASNRAH